VDVTAIEQELRIDERDPDDAAFAVVANRAFRRAVRLCRRLGISDGQVEHVGLAVVVDVVERGLADGDRVVAHGSGGIVGLRKGGDDLFEIDDDSHPPLRPSAAENALAPYGRSGSR
jgi:hypothetical protein